MSSNNIDGGWAWLVLAASFMLHLLSYGLSWSAGVYNAVLLDAFGESKAVTAWAVGLPTAVMYTIAPVSSMLTNKYGVRPVIIAGGLIAAAGLSLSYLAPNLFVLYFTFGIVSGAGFGIIYIPSIAAVSYYFDNRLTFAAGVAASGIGVGNFLYPALIRWLIHVYDWRQSILVLGAVTLNACVCGAIMRPIKRQEIQNDQPILDLTPFKVSGYIMLCVNNFLWCCGITTMYIHIPVMSEKKGMHPDTSAMLISALGIANLIGRLAYGLLGSYPRFNVFAMYGGSFFLSGVCICVVPFFDSFAGLLLCTVLFGLFSGCFGTLLVPILIQLLGLQRFANGYGCLLLFEAAGQFIGGPLTGAMFDLTQSYTLTFITGGILCIASSVVMIQPYCYIKRLSLSQEGSCKLPGSEVLDESTDVAIIKYPSHRDIVQMTVSIESLVATRQIYKSHISTQSLYLSSDSNRQKHGTDLSLLKSLLKKRKHSSCSTETV